MSISMYSGQRHSKGQPHKESFFGRTTISQISQFSANLSWILHFLGQPVRWKDTLSRYSMYLLQMVPKRPHLIKEKILWKQLYWLNSYISIFSRFFIVFSIFQDTLYHRNLLWIVYLDIWEKGTQKAPNHQEKFVGRAIILNEVIYLNF